MLQSTKKYKQCLQFVDENKPITGHHKNEGPTVYHHIKNVLRILKNEGHTELFDLFIGKYHDIGKPNVYLNPINKEKILQNKLIEGKNAMPFLGHECLNDDTINDLIIIGKRIKLSEDDINIALFVIRNHMVDMDRIIGNNKEIHKLFLNFDKPIKNKIRALEKLIMLYEVDKQYEIGDSNKIKSILNSFEVYLNDYEKKINDDKKISCILKGEKIGNYILFKVPNISGPNIGKLKNIIMEKIDEINSIEDINKIIQKGLNIC